MGLVAPPQANTPHNKVMQNIDPTHIYLHMQPPTHDMNVQSPT